MSIYLAGVVCAFPIACYVAKGHYKEKDKWSLFPAAYYFVAVAAASWLSVGAAIAGLVEWMDSK